MLFRSATRPGLAVRGTFSPARAWRPAVVTRLARTLGPSQNARPVTSLLSQLQILEIELHHPGVRPSHERLAQLLHPEFHEFGRSGRAYIRKTKVSCLFSQASQHQAVSEAFAVSEMGPLVTLLTYRSANNTPSEGMKNHAIRSSSSVKVLVGCQLRSRQGTAAEQKWCAASLPNPFKSAHSRRVRPNPSLKRSANSKPPGPPAGLAHFPSVGPGVSLPAPA